MVAVSDSGGGIYDEQGLDVPALIRGKNRGNKVKKLYCHHSVNEGQPDAQKIFNAVLDLASEKKLSPRMAAYVLVLKRIGAAVDAMGTERFFTRS